MKSKNAMLSMAAAALFLGGCELQITESDVPKDLVAAFKAKYPDAKEVKWEAEKEDGKFYYEAEWKENGKEKEVHISPDGTISAAD
jgi:hypothetical protein